jgi:4-diphosphocytidyl-2-C-methyl-D-erythritol kinase
VPLIRSAAPAKLNLTLGVIGRRADGYHLLDSLVAFTDYGDTIEVAPADTLMLAIDGPFAGALGVDGEDNLVLRAARLLAASYGVPGGASIRLIKRLPVASGIGGGSSDAAATLKALAALWGIEASPAELATLGLNLGADIPVCLHGTTARLQGIGERVTPLPSLPAAPIVLVNPGVAVATPAVFRRLNGRFTAASGDDPFSHPVPDLYALAALLRRYENDLAAPAIELAPVIEQALARLRAAPNCLLARMSGSGATCFGLFESMVAAESTAASIRHDTPHWWCVATRLGGRPRLDDPERSD